MADAVQVSMWDSPAPEDPPGRMHHPTDFRPLSSSAVGLFHSVRRVFSCFRACYVCDRPRAPVFPQVFRLRKRRCALTVVQSSSEPRRTVGFKKWPDPCELLYSTE